MTLDDISVPCARQSFNDILFTCPCKKPLANRSPAPVKSTIFNPFFIPYSTTSLPFIAIILISSGHNNYLPRDFGKVITSSKFLTSIKDVISCSFAKVISILFFTNSKNGFYVYLHKIDLIKTLQLYSHLNCFLKSLLISFIPDNPLEK